MEIVWKDYLQILHNEIWVFIIQFSKNAFSLPILFDT